MRILNSRKKRREGKAFAKDFGMEGDVFAPYQAMEGSGELWIMTRECLDFDYDGFRVDSIGLRILHGKKPTISGVQLLLGGCGKSIEISEDDARDFIEGRDIDGQQRVAAYRGHPIDLAIKGEGTIKRARKGL